MDTAPAVEVDHTQQADKEQEVREPKDKKDKKDKHKKDKKHKHKHKSKHKDKPSPDGAPGGAAGAQQAGKAALADSEPEEGEIAPEAADAAPPAAQQPAAGPEHLNGSAANGAQHPASPVVEHQRGAAGPATQGPGAERSDHAVQSTTGRPAGGAAEGAEHAQRAERGAQAEAGKKRKDASADAPRSDKDKRLRSGSADKHHHSSHKRSHRSRSAERRRHSDGKHVPKKEGTDAGQAGREGNDKRSERPGSGAAANGAAGKEADGAQRREGDRAGSRARSRDRSRERRAEQERERERPGEKAGDDQGRERGTGQERSRGRDEERRREKEGGDKGGGEHAATGGRAHSRDDSRRERERPLSLRERDEERRRREAAEAGGRLRERPPPERPLSLRERDALRATSRGHERPSDRDAGRAVSRDDRDRDRSRPHDRDRERERERDASRRDRHDSRDMRERRRSRSRDSRRRRERSQDRAAAVEDAKVAEEMEAKLAAALLGAGEDEEDRLIEERRRRRAEIAAKHRQQAELSESVANPTATELARVAAAGGASVPGSRAGSPAASAAIAMPSQAASAGGAAANGADSVAPGTSAAGQPAVSTATGGPAVGGSPASAAAPGLGGTPEAAQAGGAAEVSSAGRLRRSAPSAATLPRGESVPESLAQRAASAANLASGITSPASSIDEDFRPEEEKEGEAGSLDIWKAASSGAVGEERRDVDETASTLAAARAAEEAGVSPRPTCTPAEVDMFAADVSPDAFAAGGGGGAAPGVPRALQDNYDDAEGYYNFQVGEIMDGRYEVFALHGKGVFSTVVRARDRGARGAAPGGGQPEVAIKMIRANETMERAGQVEEKVLRKINALDPHNTYFCVRLLRTFEYRHHLCLAFEPLHMNLRELTKKYGRNVGLNAVAVQRFGYQLLRALYHLKNCGVLHADIKPDNILISADHRFVKLCDFGSAMFDGDNEITPYLVSRFYRPPEVILGLTYGYPMDVWSVGCVLYELFTGNILFPGVTNNEMLKLMMEVKGPFPKKMLKKGAFTGNHFENDPNMSFALMEEDTVTKKIVKRLVANPVAKRPFAALLAAAGAGGGEEKRRAEALADLLERMMVLDPDKRITAKEALQHPFLKDAPRPTGIKHRHREHAPATAAAK